MTTTPDEKYVVFKKDEWNEYLRTHPSPVTPGIPDAIEDAVVIRTKDRFAGPALHAYASVVLSVADATESYTDKAGLLESSDYIHNRAVEADEIRRSGQSHLPG